MHFLDDESVSCYQIGIYVFFTTLEILLRTTPIAPSIASPVDFYIALSRLWSALFLVIRSTFNNFVDWPHIGAVMHYSGYLEPRDGAVSVLLSSQQEAVACVRCIQKESHSCEG
jgi:hypothetical protein